MSGNNSAGIPSLTAHCTYSFIAPVEEDLPLDERLPRANVIAEANMGAIKNKLVAAYGDKMQVDVSGLHIEAEDELYTVTFTAEVTFIISSVLSHMEAIAESYEWVNLNANVS